MYYNIIGGSGFIGTCLCRRLNKSHGEKVRIIDINSSDQFSEKVKIADVRSVKQLREVLTEGAAIINLAAVHRDDVTPRSLYDKVNVEGARNICEVARGKSINKIIFTSSVAVYGFAPVGTDESGTIAPFNDYGRTKHEAEQIFKAWQAEDPAARTLVIIRPTVVFGEGNRGNVYNLLNQISSGLFVMIGSGENRKSMAYVENVAAFIEHTLSLPSGLHIFNYVDKPDYSMNELVVKVNRALHKPQKTELRIPYLLGHLCGKLFDLASIVTGKSFVVSSIRIKKFCSDSVYNCSNDTGNFIPPYSLENALYRTIRHEFSDKLQVEKTSRTGPN